MRTARSFAAWSTKSGTWSRSRRVDEAARAPAGAGIAPPPQAGRTRTGVGPWQDLDPGSEGAARPDLGEHAEDVRGRPDAADHADPQAARLPQPLEEAVRRAQPDPPESLQGWRRDPAGNPAGGGHHQGRRSRYQGPGHRRPQPQADDLRPSVFGGGPSQD